jgi:ATPase subunit of ABC transporter with duplicated ATPase domains
VTGQEAPTSGRVQLGPDTAVGYFAQQVPDPHATVGAFLREGLAPVFAAQQRMGELAAAMAGDSRSTLADSPPAGSVPADSPPADSLLADYAAAQDFLDHTVTRIIELDGIEVRPQTYEGGYSAYREEKARRWQRLLLDYEAQEKARRRWEADIEATLEQARGVEASTRNDKIRRYAKKVAKKAKARERRLRRQLLSARWLAEPQTRPALALAFAGEPTPLAVRGLTVRRGGRTILDHVDLDVRGGDRILIAGPNGAGKTSLLRELAAETGVALLPQTHDEVRAAVTVLDEPTNYLDFDSLDVVEEALRAYQGTLLMVTHDAYFARSVGYNRRWEVGGGQVLETSMT